MADKQTLNASPKSASVVAQAETKVYASSVDPDLWGTADFILYRKGDVLYVEDFKYGAGVMVEVEENPQLAIYAIAVMDSEAGWAFDKVVLKIFQPRGRHSDGPEREWVTTPAWLRDFRDKLKAAVAKTREHNAPLTAGEWCRWCPASAVCPAINKAVQTEAQVSFDVVAPDAVKSTILPEVRLMPVEKLAQALAWKETIVGWFESVNEYVREKLEAGEPVPGWKLVDKRSNRDWIDEARVVAEFSAVLGEDKLYERKLLSPAKLEKVVGKGKVDHLTHKPPTGKTIARDTDPRPVADRTRAQESFSVVEGFCPECDIMGVCARHAAKALPAPVADDGLMAELAGRSKRSKAIWPQ
jgi:hypothetical protein